MPTQKIRYGVVVDNKDPLYQGRARVRVFGLFDDLADEDVPWAEQTTPGLIFAGNGQGGSISVPRIGTVVGIDFDGDNYYNLYYYFIHSSSDAMIEEIKTSYEGAHVLMYDTEAQPGELHLFYTRKKGMVMELGDAKVQLDTRDGGQLRVVIKMGNDEIRMEDSKVIVNSNNILLGEGAAESIILGDTFQTYFNSHTHVGNLGAPTSPPVVPSTPNHLSTISKTKLA